MPPSESLGQMDGNSVGVGEDLTSVVTSDISTSRALSCVGRNYDVSYEQSSD